jgi:hypothetical protein
MKQTASIRYWRVCLHWICPRTVLNKFSAASELAFYDHDGGAMQVRSRNMFDGAAVMYELWHPSEHPTSRPIILVGTKPQEPEYDSEGKPLERWLHQLGPIRSHVILREDVPLRYVYYLSRRIIREPRTLNAANCGYYKFVMATTSLRQNRLFIVFLKNRPVCHPYLLQ